MSKFPKGLALSHFQGGPVKKTTLYVGDSVSDFHDVLFIFSDLLGNQNKTSYLNFFFILLHYMFQPSGPDHMLNKTGTVLKWFPPSSLPRK